MGDTANLVMNWRSVMMGMVCIPIIICALVLFLKTVEKPASRYLAAFLLVAVLSMGPQIIGYAGFYDVWPGLTYFPPFYLEAWLGPLLYLHADRLMRGGQYGWRKLLFIPGIIQIAYYSWAFFGLGDYQAKWAYNKAVHAPFVVPVESLFEISFIILGFIAIWRLKKRYNNFLQDTSSAAMDYDPIWLRHMVIAVGLAGGIYAVLEVINAINPISYNAAFPFQVLIMTILAWLALDAAWRLSKPFPKLRSSSGEETITGSESKDWPNEAKTLKSKIVEEKWYLESRLSIREVASRLGTNETYVSRSLNRGLGLSFNNLINQFRIEHAKILINQSNASVLSIALDSGFNSKATFNRVFRDITNMTPTQYKKSQIP